MREPAPHFLSVRFFIGGFLLTVVILYAFIKWADPLGISRSNPPENPALSLDEQIAEQLDAELASRPSPSPSGKGGPSSDLQRANLARHDGGPGIEAVEFSAKNWKPENEAHFKTVTSKWFSNESTTIVRTGFGPEQKYPAPAPIEVKVENECPRGVKSRFKNDFSESVKNLLGITGDSKFPKDAPIDRFTLFWKKKKEHFQVNAIWQMNDPPTYRIEKWKASDSQMNQDSEQLELEKDQPAELVWSSTQTYLEKELKAAIEDGAEEGARIFTATIGQNQATFLNAIPIRLSGENFECQVLSTGESTGRGLASCECP